MLDINYDFALYNSGFSNSKNGTQLPRHRWYQVKEAFSPELVKHAIKKANCRKTDLLFDPFCGSGTVPLVAAELDIHSITFEINPFLCFLAKTKLKNCSIQNLDLGANVIIPQIRGGAKSILENCSTFCRRPNLDKWLFNKPVLRGMEGGWVASENFDSNTKDIIRLCLIAAAMDCCNAKRDGKCLRYKKNWKNLNYGKRDFLKTFLTKMQVARSDIITSKLNQHSCRFFLDDSRNAANYDRLPDFKLCITSPPYLNSFDYSDIYRPELYLAKYVSNNHDLKKIRLKSVRSHVQINWPRPSISDFGKTYSIVFEKIMKHMRLLWDKRIPLMIQAYFEDMRAILNNFKTVAKRNAQIWMVVSTSAYAGVEIPVDQIIAEIGLELGYGLIDIGLLRSIRTSGQHCNRLSKNNKMPRLRETVVILSA